MKSESAFNIDGVKIEGVLVSEGHDGSDPSQKSTYVKYDSMEMEVSEALSLDGGPSECSRLEEQKLLTNERIGGGKVDCPSQLSTDMTATQVDVKEFACFACVYRSSRMEDVVQHILSNHPSPQPKPTSLILVQQPNAAVLPSNVQQEMAVGEGSMNSLPMSAFIDPTVKLEVENKPPVNPLQVEQGKIKIESISEPQSNPNEVHSKVSPASQQEKNFTGESCQICGHIFLNNDDAEQHTNAHWDPVGPIGTKRFPCIVCQFRTKEKSCLTRHLLTHFGRKPFACDVCGARFNRKDSLMKHLRTHTRMKQQTSDSRTTSSELTSLSSDYESNNATDVDPHVPSVESSHAFGTTAELADRTNSSHAFDGYGETATLEHVVIMSDLKAEPSDQLIPNPDDAKDPLCMDQSEEQSQDSDPSSIFGLKDCANGKPFTCNFCNYETRKKYDLVVHTRIHTGETPFACDLCDKKYIARKTLNRHKKVHHGEKLFACGLCDHRTLQKLEMDQHVRSQHNAESIMVDPSRVLDGFRHEPSNSDLNEELSQEGGPSWSYETVEEPGTKHYSCDTCDYKTKQKSYLEDHLKTHTGENLFECDFCDKKYTTKKAVDRHLRVNHGEKLFSCSLCEYRAAKKSELTEHIQTHIESEAANHSVDEVKHASPNELEFELSSGPSECTQPGTDPFRTELDDAPCDPTNDPFHLELSNEHSQDSGVSRSSEADTVSCKNKRHTCEVCGYKTSRKYEYTVHMRTHTGEKPYKCSLCDYRTVRKSYVAKHMKTHLRSVTSNERVQFDLRDSPELGNVSENNGLTDTTPGRSLSGDEHFKCEYCDYECDGITAWSQHMFEHTSEKTYSCDDCDYKTKLKSDMALHRSAHAPKIGQAVKITCEFCDYLFITKDDMSQHIMTSHPEKCPHSCDMCDFKAFNARSLELHKESHTKPYACSLCDYRSEEESQLTSHVASTHASVQEYVCYSCDYKANSVEAVEQHIFTTHNLSAADATPLLCVSTETPSAVIDPSTIPQPQVQQYLCYACDYKASELGDVEQHILLTHPTPVVQEVAVPLMGLNSEAPNFLTTPSNSEGYFCITCDFKASSISELEQHIQNSHITKPEPST